MDPFGESEEQAKCPVCMEPFGDRKTIVLTKCRHRYHAECRMELEMTGFVGCTYQCEGSDHQCWVPYIYPEEERTLASPLDFSSGDPVGSLAGSPSFVAGSSPSFFSHGEKRDRKRSRKEKESVDQGQTSGTPSSSMMALQTGGTSLGQGLLDSGTPSSSMMPLFDHDMGALLGVICKWISPWDVSPYSLKAISKSFSPLYR